MTSLAALVTLAQVRACWLETVVEELAVVDSVLAVLWACGAGDLLPTPRQTGGTG